MNIAQTDSNGKKSPTWLLTVIVAISSLLIGSVTTTFTRELSIQKEVSELKVKIATDYFTKEDAKQMKKDIITALDNVEKNLLAQMDLYDRSRH